MRLQTITLLLASVLLSLACGPKTIQKQPIPHEDRLESFRLMAEGDELVKQGMVHLALVKYLEASQLNPYSEFIFNKLGMTYSRLQMYDQARRAAERAVGLNRNYPYAYNTLGIVYLAERNSSRAIRSFQRALDLLPETASFYANLGYAYIQRNDFDRGLEAYSRALELDPSVFGRGEGIQLAYEEEREEAEAERHYLMARLFAELGERESCLHHLERALISGFRDQRRLGSDPAFDSVRQDPAFVELLGSFGMLSG